MDCGPQRRVHGPQPVDHRTPKSHKITKSQKCTQDPEKAKRATNSIFIKSQGKEGPNIRRAQWNSSWDTTQGHAPKRRTD
ncbi:hypothetical protein O181_014484 [Austropuccinia psidii MF-1]|uniref:Uncharacterized protein n=1 Tax=Austropuccinia psidii MF-1 TaxID=1389203 RepID=A0A9Q3C066_9BASI|nr:hypothetical protein [Austropuccinia psidii MF-1]